MSFYYIASPYSNPDPAVCEGRYYEAMAFVAWALKTQPSNPVPFSPILYCHPMAAVHTLPTDYQWWLDFNRAIIRAAENVTVLRIPGWEESKGVQDEIEFAKANYIPHLWADLNGDGTYTLKLA